MGTTKSKTNGMKDRRSLTKAIFLMALSKQYLEDYKRDCVQQDKYLVSGWIRKIESGLNDIYSIMTPESREQYLKEVKCAEDILAWDAIFGLTLMMDNNQRELFETIGNGIVKGELIEFAEDKQ